MKTKTKDRIYTVTIPRELHLVIKGLAAANDRSMLEEVAAALWAWVRRPGKGNDKHENN